MHAEIKIYTNGYGEQERKKIKDLFFHGNFSFFVAFCISLFKIIFKIEIWIPTEKCANDKHAAQGIFTKGNIVGTTTHLQKQNTISMQSLPQRKPLR